MPNETGGLDDLKKNDIENVFSYTLNKFETTDEFLNAFKPTLEQLYNVKDYNGGWNSEAIDKAVQNYIDKTDAIKADYEAKKWVKIAGSSITIVGSVMSFTPLAPIGWGLAGTGTAVNAITDVVDLVDNSKQKAWESAKNTLRDYVNNPFQETTFKVVYDNLMETFRNIKSKVAIDDYSILLQGLGWNYFVFRKEGMSNEDAINQLRKTLELFRTQRYTLSTELRAGQESAINDIRNIIEPSSDSLLQTAGSLALIGLAAGVAIGTMTAGVNLASSTFRYAENIARGLVRIGSYTSRAVNIMVTLGPYVAIIGGVASIIFDVIALNKLDETFKPYYEYKDKCVELLNKYKEEYMKNNDIIVEMIRFMNEDKKEKES